MHSALQSAAISGASALPVEVQVDLSLGLPGFHLVGLPDHACQDAKTRVLAAIRNSGFHLPQKKIIVNLAPGDLRKEGAAFDLPIALGILRAADLLPLPDRVPLVVGELSLAGDLLPVRGVLPIALEARRRGFASMIVSHQNAAEGALVQGLRVYGARTLTEAAEMFVLPETYAPAVAPSLADAEPPAFDMADVRGQDSAKNALVIAAAGGHNALLIGPPGSGKTMLARRLPTILPSLSFEEALEATSIWSIAGRLQGRGLLTMRPFRAPHHTISAAGLIGGGPPLRPGEISLASNGVLFMDEIVEFSRYSLEALRQPLEDGHVTIVRARERATLPARFMLIGAMNPCPCGLAHDGKEKSACRCTVPQKVSYMGRISGPILDRFDIHIEVPAVNTQDLVSTARGETSASMRERVERARMVQRERFADLPGIHCNAHLQGAALRELAGMTAGARAALTQQLETKHFSARAHDRLIKLARTIADLRGSAGIERDDIVDAAEWRCLDKPIEGPPPRNDALRVIRTLAAERNPDRQSGQQPREGT